MPCRLSGSLAVTRIMPLHLGKGRTLKAAFEKIFDYVENSEKTDNGNLISTYQCSREIIDGEFEFSNGNMKIRPG